MKIKVGQKVRIGKSAKCIEALENFLLHKLSVTPILGRVAVVKELTTFVGRPAVHLKFRAAKGGITDPHVYWPVSVLRKP